MKPLFRRFNDPRCAALLIISTLFGCGRSDRTPLEQAEYYFSRPDYDKALEASLAALNDATSDEVKAQIHVIRGRCYLDLGAARQNDADLLKKASEEFTKSINFHDNAEARHGRRIVSRITGNTLLAAQDYERIRELDPSYQSAYVNERPQDIRLNRPKPDEIAEDEDTADQKPNRRNEDDLGNQAAENDDEDEQAEVADTSALRATPRDERTAESEGERPILSGPLARGSRKDASSSPSADTKDTASRYTKWLSQHTLDYDRPVTEVVDDIVNRANRGLAEELAENSGDESGDPEAENELIPRQAPLIQPFSNWPPFNQAPRLQTVPSLPTTGLVGPTISDGASPGSSQPRYTGIVPPTPPTGIVGQNPYPTGLSAPGSGIPTTGIPSSRVPNSGITGLPNHMPVTGTGLLPNGTPFGPIDHSISNPFVFTPRGPIGPVPPDLPHAPSTQPQFQTSPLAAPIPGR